MLEGGAPGGQGVSDVEGGGAGEGGEAGDLVVEGGLGAGGDRQGTTAGTSAASGSGAADGSGSAAGSACSRTTWALVPLMPKEETPARRGRPVSGQSVRSVSRRTEPEDQSTCREGWSACRVFGRTPWRMAMTILMTPATPAAAWACVDVRLDGAEQQRVLRVAVLAVGGEQGLCLDGVAEGGAGAVRLDRVHVGGGQAGAVQGLADDALLRGPVGRGEPVGGAVLVDGGAADHGEDGVAVAAGRRTASPAGACRRPRTSRCRRPRRRRPCSGRRRPVRLAAELHERAGGGHDVDAAGQGEGALAPRAARGWRRAGRRARRSRRCRR